MPRISHRVSFSGGNGFELAGIVDSAGDAAPVVVFSHCFTCNKDLKAIVRIARGLAEGGITVLRYDMTGLGGSDGDFSRTNFTTNLADLHAAITYASDNLGKVTALIGHSFGGAASLAVAATGKINSLRCIATLAAPSDTTHLAALLSLMNPEIERSGVGDVTIGGVTWTIRREMLADFRSHDLPQQLTQIRLPVMLFQSPHDTTVHFDHALRIMTLVQSASGGQGTASLVVLPGADHLLSNPTDIEYVTATIAALVHRFQ